MLGVGNRTIRRSGAQQVKDGNGSIPGRRTSDLDERRTKEPLNNEPANIVCRLSSTACSWSRVLRNSCCVPRRPDDPFRSSRGAFSRRHIRCTALSRDSCQAWLFYCTVCDGGNITAADSKSRAPEHPARLIPRNHTAPSWKLHDERQSCIINSRKGCRLFPLILLIRYFGRFANLAADEPRNRVSLTDNP